MLWVNGGGGIDMDRDGAYSQAFIKLGLSMDEVRQTALYVGGRYCHWTEQRGVAITPWLARKLKMPVRYVYNRKDAFSTCISEKSFRTRLGFTNEGVITAVQMYSLNEVGVGWRDSISPLSAVSSGVAGFSQGTNCTDLFQQLEQAFTNTALLTVDPTNFNTELPNMAFSHIAAELEKDPIDIMTLNLKPNGKFSMDLCLEAAKNAFDWDGKYHAPGTETLPDGRLHGLAMAIGWVSSSRSNRANMNLCLKRDGKVYLPYNEMEVGIHVGDMHQLVIAEETGMKVEDVIVYYAPHYPNWCSAASDDRASCASYTAKEAALNLKRAICQKGFAQLGAQSADEVDIVDSRLVLKSDPSKNMALGGLINVNGWSDSISKYRSGKLDELQCMFIDFCEVAVDTETGDVETLQHVMTHDYGKVIRRSSCIGQIELHSIMFDGAGRLEEVVWDKATGALLSGNMIDYKVPTRLDISPVDIIPVESRNGYGAYGASSLGHAHLQRSLMVAAVSNALGTWVTSAPVTPDKVLRALGKIG
jgi:CO/xanthine dehydrogenase Mo-binding subunit